MAAVEGIKRHLLRESEPNKLMFFGELLGGHSFSPKMVIYSDFLFTIKYSKPCFQGQLVYKNFYCL